MLASRGGHTWSLMPRPKTVSDEEVLRVAMRLMGQLGPSGFTLAEVGRVAGIAPATLVQRFGSKRNLLLAVVAQGSSSMDEFFDQALAGAASPLSALLDLTGECAAFLGKPGEMANHLAFLQIDLSDPDFHRHMVAQFRAMRAGFERMLKAAERAGEIRPGAAANLARMLQIVYNGALLVWCVEPRDDVRKFVRAQVEAILAPWRLARSGRPGPPRRRQLK